jgi:cytochrome c peroxidase
MYARFIPPLTYDAAAQRFTGGLFWDGRASTLEEQAAKPLLNPLEMNNADVAAVAAELRAASYADDFRAVFGATALDEPDVAFGHLTDALAAYERTDALAPFSSKYDRYLAGADTLTAAEQRGLAIFEDPARGNCASCHPSRPSADGTPPLFTDYSYANLGLPKYMNSRFLAQPADMNPDGPAYIDHGLMTTVGDPAQYGKFRVPTLRNIAVTGPYGHNGYFENLPHLLDFLNTRDVGSPTIGTRKAPEVNANVDAHVGKLGLSAQDLDDLFAFLNTLTDE